LTKTIRRLKTVESYMFIAIVPLGCSEKVIEAANEAGATGATVMRGRGIAKPAKEGFFSFHVEPEEDIVIIIASKEVIEKMSHRLYNEFKTNIKRGGSIYIMPVQSYDNL